MRLVVGLILVAAAASCSGAPSDPYPLPSGTPSFWENNPAEVGTGIQSVVLYLTPRPGDRIELLGAEPVGETNGAEVRFFVSRPVLKPDGTSLIGEQLEPLAGAVVSNESTTAGPENTVGIVAEIDAGEPGRYQLTSVRLRYRLNGGAEQVGEGIDVIFTVCAAIPAPAKCEE